MAITITDDVTKIVEDGWDFPIEELDYLLEEHDGETFALKDGRLWECGETKNAKCVQDLADMIQYGKLELYNPILSDEFPFWDVMIDRSISDPKVVEYGELEVDDYEIEGSTVRAYLKGVR